MIPQALLKQWQKRLRLGDWKIRVRERELFDLDVGTCVGQVTSMPEKKIAVIDITTEIPAGTILETVEGSDPEIALVHELLHLSLWAWKVKEDTVEAQIQEAVIHALSTAMVELKREGG